jgi:large subunit ribosomal protein L25
MSEILLEALARENTKKSASKKYRREGFIPSIIYGQGKNTNILINNHSFKKLYPKLTRSTVINLKLDNKKYDVLIKDYDKDQIKNEFTHLDFFELDSKKEVNVSIPLDFIGSAIGIREGGLLEKHLTKINVSCFPKDLIPSIKVNIDNLKMNESLHVRDLKLEKQYKLISHLDEVLVRISSAQKEEVVETVAVAETEATTAVPSAAVPGDKSAPASEEKSEKK